MLADPRQAMVEAAAKRHYESYFASLIGCCEPAWGELPEDHRLRLIDAMDAVLDAMTTGEVREEMIKRGCVGWDEAIANGAKQGSDLVRGALDAALCKPKEV